MRPGMGEAISSVAAVHGNNEHKNDESQAKGNETDRQRETENDRAGGSQRLWSAERRGDRRRQRERGDTWKTTRRAVCGTMTRSNTKMASQRVALPARLSPS